MKSNHFSFQNLYCLKVYQSLFNRLLSLLQTNRGKHNFLDTYSTICPVICVSVAGGRPCLIATGLYGNATLAGLQASLLNRLQSVINAAARSIAGLCRSEHITECSREFPLAPSARAHQVQTGRHRLPSSLPHCTSVPIGPASVRR